MGPFQLGILYDSMITRNIYLLSSDQAEHKGTAVYPKATQTFQLCIHTRVGGNQFVR